MSGLSTGATAPNLLYPHKADLYAARIARVIGIVSLRMRFTTVAAAALRADPRNTRPLRERDIKDAPPWLAEARAQGRDVRAFAPNWRATRKLRMAACALAEACAEIMYCAVIPREGMDRKDRVADQVARELVQKAKRLTLKGMLDRANILRRAHKQRNVRRNAHVVLFAREEIYAAPGRVWRRICSVAELSKLGVDMDVCLADTSAYHARYAAWLRNDIARFWALYDQNDTPIMAVMIDAVGSRLLEARLPNNALASLDDLDLAALVRARDIVIDPPRLRSSF